jgi:hypothetical protein
MRTTSRSSAKHPNRNWLINLGPLSREVTTARAVAGGSWLPITHVAVPWDVGTGAHVRMAPYSALLSFPYLILTGIVISRV